MTMTSSSDIFDVITSHQRLWPLLLTLVPNTDMDIRLDLRTLPPLDGKKTPLGTKSRRTHGLF